MEASFRFLPRLKLYVKHINASLGKNVSKLPFRPSLAFITTALEENDPPAGGFTFFSLVVIKLLFRRPPSYSWVGVFFFAKKNAPKIRCVVYFLYRYVMKSVGVEMFRASASAQKRGIVIRSDKFDGLQVARERLLGMYDSGDDFHRREIIFYISPRACHRMFQDGNFFAFRRNDTVYFAMMAIAVRQSNNESRFKPLQCFYFSCKTMERQRVSHVYAPSRRSKEIRFRSEHLAQCHFQRVQSPVAAYINGNRSCNENIRWIS